MKLRPSVALFIGLGMAFALTIHLLNQYAQPLLAEHQEAKARALMLNMIPSGHDESNLQSFTLLAPNYLKMGDVQTAARLMQNNKPIQVIYRSISHEGYAGPIGILASFDEHCTVMRVEIISEKETPGLGDQYKKNNWLETLRQKKSNTHWAIKPEGEIDSWTGATVTPRAITHALHRMQLLCVHEHDLLFSLEPVVYLEIGQPDA